MKALKYLWDNLTAILAYGIAGFSLIAKDPSGVAMGAFLLISHYGRKKVVINMEIPESSTVNIGCDKCGVAPRGEGGE